MDPLRTLGIASGATCVAIGGLQMIGGKRIEPGMSDADATVDSHIRFMGSVFVAYGLGWIETSRGPEPDVRRLRVLAGLMAAGGVSRMATRASVERPHRFHDVLLAIEVTAPALLELVVRRASTPS